MRGLPGSGKSTLAHSLCGVIFSTDDYWYRPDNIYDFNPKLIQKAHSWNFNRFNSGILLNYAKIILDNTNIKKIDYKNYVELAERNGYVVEEVIPTNPWSWDVDECAKRNTHNVSREVIQKMFDRWEP